MDASVDTLYGPHPINKANGNVTVPKELLVEIGVERGQKVHWMLNPDLPGTLILIPTAQVARALPAITEALRKHGR